MDVTEAIKSRRSIRKFKSKHVEWDKMGKILDSARYAPTSGNLQNWKVIVVSDIGQKRKIAEACHDQTWMEKAPYLIVVLCDPERAELLYGPRGFRMYSLQNTSAVMMNMIMTATELGLGTCWVGAFEEEVLRGMFNYPEVFQCHAILAIGYSDEKPPLQPRNRIETMVFLGGYLVKRRHVPMGLFSLEVEKRFRAGVEKLKKTGKKLAGEKEK